jgi:hypothetical protein
MKFPASYTNKTVFLEMEDRQVNQVLPGGWKECEWGRCREKCRRLNMGGILHTNIKWKHETC